MAQKLYVALVLLLASNLCAIHRDLPKDYYEYPAQEKQDFLYLLLHESKYEKLPELGTKIDQIIARFKADAKTVLSIVGSVAKIRFESHSKTYSGIYASGTLGLIRFALSANFEPIIEIKFLIDESPSLNLKLQGQPNNLFTKEFTSLPSHSNSNLLSYLNNEEPEYQVSNLALRSKNGRLVFDVNPPYQLTFIPSQSLKQLMQERDNTEFREVLTNLQAGTLLYEVWTKATAEDCAIHTGSIVLESEFIASLAGDRRIFR